MNNMLFRYITKGNLDKKEQEGLYNLCLQENELRASLSNTYSKNKLKVYGKINKFHFDFSKPFDYVTFYENRNNYEFILVKDRKQRVLGYIAFSHGVIDYEEEIKDIFVVKHMYIANECNHTNIDIFMFWLLENIVDKCIIYSEVDYRGCSKLNGYLSFNQIMYNKNKRYSMIKVKTKISYPVFFSFLNKGLNRLDILSSFKVNKFYNF